MSARRTKKEEPEQRYFVQSRSLAVSLVAVLPLVGIYEVGIVALRSRVENHAGLLVKRMIGVLGMDVYLVLTGAVALSFVLAVAVKAFGSARGFRDYWAMLLEAGLYAALLGPLVYLVQSRLTPLSASIGAADRLLQALLYVGAGVWEELVFRLAFLGGLLFLTIRLLRGNALVFGVLGVLLTSVAFAGFHHVGALGEPFSSARFLFRFLAGTCLALVYLFRGLGICVYTHAFYNVGLLFSGLAST